MAHFLGAFVGRQTPPAFDSSTEVGKKPCTIYVGSILLPVAVDDDGLVAGLLQKES